MFKIWSAMKLNLSKITFATIFMACAVVLPQAASAQSPIKIGFGMALTGGLGCGGKTTLLAYQIWKDEINAKVACSADQWSLSTTTIKATPQWYRTST